MTSGGLEYLSVWHLCPPPWGRGVVFSAPKGVPLVEDRSSKGPRLPTGQGDKRRHEATPGLLQGIGLRPGQESVERFGSRSGRRPQGTNQEGAEARPIAYGPCPSGQGRTPSNFGQDRI